jgi:hypothetical protein
MALARLLVARKDYVRADQIASQLLAPQPIIYLTYLPAMYAVRTRAARELGMSKHANSLQQRRDALRK